MALADEEECVHANLVISCYLRKGGTKKSTSCYCSSVRMRVLEGENVAIFDLDPQANLTGKVMPIETKEFPSRNCLFFGCFLKGIGCN
jgi:hypothetical protein